MTTGFTVKTTRSNSAQGLPCLPCFYSENRSPETLLQEQWALPLGLSDAAQRTAHARRGSARKYQSQGGEGVQWVTVVEATSLSTSAVPVSRIRIKTFNLRVLCSVRVWTSFPRTKGNLPLNPKRLNTKLQPRPPSLSHPPPLHKPVLGLTAQAPYSSDFRGLHLTDCRAPRHGVNFAHSSSLPSWPAKAFLTSSC